jgi:hypothetical protein
MSSGQTFQQIGTDQGLLAAPVTLKICSVAPGERGDLIVDFSDHAGEQIVLKNDMLLPVLQFRVVKGKVNDDSTVPSNLRPVPKIAESEAVKTRPLMLGEISDLHGDSVTMLLNNAHWSMPITENPTLDSVEIWELINVTDDAHPIHLHMVKFQILDRRRFAAFAYQNENSLLRYRGNPVPPEPSEAGWKDTVRADPGMITRIIVKFEGYVGVCVALKKHSSLNIPFCATNSLECNILPLNYLDSIICRQAPESVSRNPNHSNILRKRSEKNRRAVLLSGAARSKATCSEVEASLRLHGPSHQQESFSAPLRPTQAKAPTRADPTAPERMRRTGTPK